MTPPQDPLRMALTEILAAVDATPADVALEKWVRFQSAMLAVRAALRAAPAEPQPAVDVERQVRQDEPGDIYPNGYGCSQCDGTGFMPQTAIDRLRAEGFRVPWSDYPAGTAHLDPDSELGRAVAADQGKTALPTATEPADGPGEREAREFIESITVFRPVDAEVVNAILDELQESPLPGARYAHEVVKRRFAAALSKPASPAIAARDGGET